MSKAYYAGQLVWWMVACCLCFPSSSVYAYPQRNEAKATSLDNIPATTATSLSHSPVSVHTKGNSAFTASHFFKDLYLIHRTTSIQEPILRSGGSLRSVFGFNDKHGFVNVDPHSRPGIYMSLNYILHDDENNVSMKHKQTVVIIPAALLWNRLTNAAVNDMCLMGDVNLLQLKAKGVLVITGFSSTCAVMKKNGVPVQCLQSGQSIQSATFDYLKKQKAPILTPVIRGFSYYDTINVTTPGDDYKTTANVLPKVFFDNVGRFVQIGKEAFPNVPNIQYSLSALFQLRSVVDEFFVYRLQDTPLVLHALWPRILLMDIHISKLEQFVAAHTSAKRKPLATRSLSAKSSRVPKGSALSSLSSDVSSVEIFIKEMKKRRFQVHLLRSFIVKYRFLPYDFYEFAANADTLWSMADGHKLLIEHPELQDDFLQEIRNTFEYAEEHSGDPGCEFRAIDYMYWIHHLDNIHPHEFNQALQNLKTKYKYKIAERQELGFKSLFYGIKMVREGTGMIVSPLGKKAAKQYQSQLQRAVVSLMELKDKLKEYDLLGSLGIVNLLMDPDHVEEKKEMIKTMFALSESIVQEIVPRGRIVIIDPETDSKYAGLLFEKQAFSYPTLGNVDALDPEIKKRVKNAIASLADKE